MFKLNTPHYLTGEELSKKEMADLLNHAIYLKKHRRTQFLTDKTVGLLFHKPSLRTRVSFSAAILEANGQVIEVNSTLTKKESPADTIRVLQGYVNGLMVRTFDHGILEEMKNHAKIPLINGLSDDHHPCQVLADLMTLQENFKNLQGLKLCYIGDGNNMLHSLLLMAPFMGVDVHYCCPKGYQPKEEILSRAKTRAEWAGAKINKFNSVEEAVQNCNAIYTDVWASMGFEEEQKKREVAFQGYQVNSALYKLAAPGAIIMHCMPVNEGQEITREMMEHEKSVLFQQSENRLHAQKALLQGIFSGVLTGKENSHHGVQITV